MTDSEDGSPLASEESSAQETIKWLNDIMVVLKAGGITQRRLGDEIGLTSGSITQYLRAGQGDSYPIDRVVKNPETVTRIIGAMRTLSSSIQHRLDNASQALMAERLIDLAKRYPQPEPIYGMGGEELTREAANYVDNKLDSWLDALLADHTGSYGMITVAQVCGAPGQGKSWALARLKRRAEDSHTVIWERTGGAGREGIARFTRGLRAEQLERYESLWIKLTRDPVRRKYEQLIDEVAEKMSRLGHTGSDLVEALEQLGAKMIGDRIGEKEKFGKRFPLTLKTLRELLEVRTEGLERDPVLGSSDKNVAYLQGPRDYDVADFAKDLALLAALADANNACSYVLNEAELLPAGPKFLILIDSPDRDGDPSDFMTPLRALQQRRGEYPLIDSFMIVVSKTMFGDGRNPVTNSTLRYVRDLEPFTSIEIKELLGKLRRHGWFKHEVFTDVTTDQIHKKVMLLGGGNRRATCLYLDFINSANEFHGPKAYLGIPEGKDDGSRGDVDAKQSEDEDELDLSNLRPPLDERVRRWLINWVSFVANVQQRYVEASPLDHQLIEDVLDWCAAGSDDIRELHPAARDHAERFGLISRSASSSLLQKVIRRQIGDTWQRRPQSTVSSDS